MNIKTTYLSIHELGQRGNQEDNIYPSSGAAAAVPELYIVCDGMGGHEGGEVASDAICEGFSSYLESHPSEVFSREEFKAALDAAYDLLDSRDNGNPSKMGTTLTMLRFHQGGCLAAHVGDSRIYQIRPSQRRILYVSRDHSLVNDLILLGEITPEEASSYPGKNVITRALMPNCDRRDKGDVHELTDILPGDYFYMCTDGMLENIDDNGLLEIICKRGEDQEKISALLENSANNRDNHSAMLIRVLSV